MCWKDALSVCESVSWYMTEIVSKKKSVVRENVSVQHVSECKCVFVWKYVSWKDALTVCVFVFMTEIVSKKKSVVSERMGGNV